VSDPRAAARDRVAQEALALVEPAMALGLGTGDTALRFVAALAARGHRGPCVATSGETAALARARGLDVRALPEVGALDLAVDGADEVDPALDLVKGGGGAMTRERIVAASAARFVVLVDSGKLVARLGAFPVAVEPLPEARVLVERRLAALGATVVARPARSGTGPWITDLGNPLLDARFGPIADAKALSAALDAIPGVVGHGLFVGMASLVLVADLAGTAVRRLEAPSGGLPRP